MTDRALPNRTLENISDSNFLRLPNHLSKSISYLEDKNIRLIQKAYSFAFIAHDGQLRKDGSSYISHPVEVAKILADLKMDQDTISSALLHDVLEDCNVPKVTLEKEFNKSIADIVDGVTKLGNIKMKDREERNRESFQKMALAMSKDVRVILVKLCDRLHNIRTIDFVPRNKQIGICKETMEIYGPLALRVGMQEIASELENRCFKCIHPFRYSLLQNAIKKSSGGREKIVEKIRKELKYHLRGNGVNGAVVRGRKKTIYSIYKKIKTKHKPFSQILDVYGFRILVDSVDECYKALGIIHNYFPPIENRFKDYVAIPKSNGYQAIHTSLLALRAVPIEVQIQTKNMWETSNTGIAAHWGYKVNDSSPMEHFRSMKWLKAIKDINKKSDNSSEFVESIKMDLATEEVYVFSPKGHIYGLNKGATPIDFAYEVHTDLGDRILGCKVNRSEVPLNVQLESGQTVEIIKSDKIIEADPAWLNFVTTSKARSGIRARLKKQKASSARRAGKIMLESELNRSGTTLKEYRGNRLKRILDTIGVSSLNKLLTDLGSGKRTGNIIAKTFYSGLQIRADKKEERKQELTIIDNKIEGIPVLYARCCLPVFGDKVIAHSDTDRGIVIHHKKCRGIEEYLGVNPRYISTNWGDAKENQTFTARIKVNTMNKIGVMSEVVSIFTRETINIVSLTTKSIDKNFEGFEIEIDVSDKEQLNKIMQKIRQKKFTSSCKRLINERKN